MGKSSQRSLESATARGWASAGPTPAGHDGVPDLRYLLPHGVLQKGSGSRNCIWTVAFTATSPRYSVLWMIEVVLKEEGFFSESNETKRHLLVF